MVFFLISNFIFEEKVKVMASPLDRKIAVSATEYVKIYEWVYDKKENKMQVILDLSGVNKDYTKFKFEAFQRSNNAKVETNNVYNEDNIYIVDIKGFDKDYTQIALDIIGEKSNEFDEIDTDFDSEEEDDDEITDSETLIFTAFMDYREIEKENLKAENKDQYIEYVTKVLIENHQKEISVNNKKIALRKKKITKIDGELEALNSEKIYAVGDERIEIENEISSLESQIQDQNEGIEELKSDNDLIHEKIEKRKQKQAEKFIQ